jgi:spermidine synthase
VADKMKNEKLKIKRFSFAILIMGFSGIVAQILLLRELIVTFLGNELSIGIILANWLILEALGCFYLGKRAEHLKHKIEAFVGLTLLFSLSLPIAIYLTRILKEIIGVTSGEGLGLLPILSSSFLILFPVSLSHGALFTFACKIYSATGECTQPSASAIGKVYVYETIGTIVGGIAFTYLLIPHFHSFRIAFGVALLNLVLCVFLLLPFNSISIKSSVFRQALAGVSVAFLILTGFLVFSKGVDIIHWFSIRGQWKDQNVVHYQNSIYGNICVIQRGEQYTFFSDGIPTITTPTPDIVFVEEFVHLPMLSHPDPKKILVISGGAGGVIKEILKYPVERIDYAELDPTLVKVIRKFPTQLTQDELNDPRVNISHVDGRFFVKKTIYKYDLVFIGLSNPQELQVNRLFTKEFFSSVKKKLEEKGILVISLPGSLTYLSEELKNLNKCILNTLKNVYPYLRIIPGDGTNLYLASSAQEISMVNHELLSRRLWRRNINTGLITPSHIEYKLHPRWLNWFLRSVEDGTKKINQDFQPIGVFYSLSYWNALFSPSLQKFFRWFEKVNISSVSILVGIFVLFFIFLHVKIVNLSKISIPFAVTTTGFAGMIFDLALLFTFQALYGFVYYWIGLLVTAFMVGVAAGSLMMTSIMERIRKDISSFLNVELALTIFSGIIPLIFLFFRPYLEYPGVFLLLKIIFLLLSFFSGLLIGAEFPLANKIYLKSGVNLSKTAGLLYGCDLFGGWIGGIIGGVILLPILGLIKTCMVIVMIKVSSMIVLYTTARVCQRKN